MARQLSWALPAEAYLKLYADAVAERRRAAGR
jgi:hypothetical protein